MYNIIYELLYIIMYMYIHAKGWLIKNQPLLLCCYWLFSYTKFINCLLFILVTSIKNYRREIWMIW